MSKATKPAVPRKRPLFAVRNKGITTNYPTQKAAKEAFDQARQDTENRKKAKTLAKLIDRPKAEPDEPVTVEPHGPGQIYGVVVSVRLPAELFREVDKFHRECVGNASLSDIIRVLITMALKQKRPKP